MKLFQNWAGKNPQFSRLASDPFFQESMKTMAKNFDIPLEAYLESFTEGVLRKNPDLPLDEVASISFQNNQKLRRYIESGNATGIPESIRKAYNEAIIRESKCKDSMQQLGNNLFDNNETPVLLANAQLQLPDAGYASSKNQELSGNKKSYKNYGNLINNLQKSLEIDPRFQLMSSFEIPQKAIPQAISVLGIPQVVQKFDDVLMRKEMEKQDALKRIEKKWIEDRGDVYFYTTPGGRTVEFEPNGINKPITAQSHKFEYEIYNKKWRDLGAIKIGKRSPEYNCFAHVLIGGIGYLSTDKAQTILDNEYCLKCAYNAHNIINITESRKINLANKLNQGDVVVYYKKNNEMIHMGEVVGIYNGKIYVLSKASDLGTYIHEICNVPDNYKEGGFRIYDHMYEGY